jgi:thiamine-monophosphate kinase
MMAMDDVWENRLLGRWATLLPRSPAQRGAIHESDAELVPLGDGRFLALTVDQVVEEVRVGLYRDPETIGRIAATAALSDLAAVGAEPLGLLLAVTLPAGHAADAQTAIARGVADVTTRAGTFVLGGDTSEGELLTVSCTAAGLVSGGEPLLRTGARPGDRIFASGPMGAGSALAASALLGLLPRFDESELRPALRLAEGRASVGLASACMDTSDGLVATLDQLARLNEVSLEIDADPRELLCPAARRVCTALGVSPLAVLAAPHGEFELVTTVPPAATDLWLERIRAAGGAPIAIGEVRSGAGLSVGGRSVDGARVRNVWASSGGDARRALVTLAELCG